MRLDEITKGVSIVKEKKTSEGRALRNPYIWRSANEEKPTEDIQEVASEEEKNQKRVVLQSKTK